MSAEQLCLLWMVQDEQAAGTRGHVPCLRPADCVESDGGGVPSPPESGTRLASASVDEEAPSCGCSSRYACPDGSCALEHASRGGMSRGEVAAVFGLTKQTIAWIERRALEKVRRQLAAMGVR